MSILFRMCALLVLLSSSVLRGQVLNVENKRFHDDSLGWAGNSMLRFNLVQNTQRVFQIGSNLHLQYRTLHSRILMLGEINYLQSGDNAPVNTGYGHVRWGRKLTNVLTLESFVQGQFNKPLKMDLRLISGVGLRWRLANSSKVRVYLASLPMAEFEEVKADNQINRNIRLSSYVSMHWDVTPTLEFENTTYYQPRINTLNDYRLAGESSLKMKLGQRLSWGVSYQYLFDTRQPTDIPRWTYRLENRLEFSF
jgi:hypothetical protein